MIQHEEHWEIPQWLSWLLLALLTLGVVSWCMFLMMMVMDTPREWDFGAFQDVPGQSVYSTQPSAPRFTPKHWQRFDPKLVPLQMPRLPEAKRSPKASETAMQPGGARP